MCIKYPGLYLFLFKVSFFGFASEFEMYKEGLKCCLGFLDNLKVFSIVLFRQDKKNLSEEEKW